MTCTKCSLEYDITPHMLIGHKSKCQVCFGQGSAGIFRKVQKEGINPKDYKTTLYIIKGMLNNESFIKVGITGRTVEQRFNGDPMAQYSYEVLLEYTTTLDVARKMETYALLKYKTYKYTPTIEFRGNTECLSLDCYDLLIEDLKNTFQFRPQY